MNVGTIYPSFIYELIVSASSLFSLIAARRKSLQENVEILIFSFDKGKT